MRLILTLLALGSFADEAAAGPRHRASVRHQESHWSTATPQGTFTGSAERTVVRGNVGGAMDAIAEVNAARAARGLPPYLQDPALTAAAQACAAVRAAHGIRGHTQNDFAYLPAGASAAAAGCGALEPSWGWATCATYERHTYAGAAVVMGADGRRYMHLFIR